MADAAATGTLVLVAASGGIGVFLGTLASQWMQGRRERRQQQREDARHERERQEALDDERTKRREDRYVALLTQLTRLDRALQETWLLAEEVVRYRDLAELPEALGSGTGDVERAIADSAAQRYLLSWKEAEEARADVSKAFDAAYAVASTAVRDVGTRVIDWPRGGVAGVHLKMLAENDLGQFFIPEGAESRWVDRNDYAAHIGGELAELRGLLADVDRLVRQELRLD